MTPSRSEQRSHSLGHPKWMTQELIEQTIRVWSTTLRREVKESEAVEMLMSMRRLGALARECRMRKS
jgi:hypothetical protein